MAVRKDKRNGTWMFDGKYKDVFGNWKSYRKTGFHKKSDAIASEIEFLESRNGSKKMSLNALVKMYEENTFDIKDSTLKTNSIYYEKSIKPYFGDMSIGDITYVAINKWLIELVNKGYKPSTANHIKTILSKYLNYGVKMQILNYNPCSLVKNYKDANAIEEKKEYWNKDDFEHFISFVDDKNWNDIFRTFYYTGMRKGEMLALNWNDIDFEKRKITINKTISKNGVITSPKTKNSNRKIGINNSLYNLLLERFERDSKIDGFSFDWFVFGAYKHIGFTTLLNKLNHYCDIASMERINPHMFRHINASILISSNKFSDILIAERLGHSVSTLLTTYAHVYEQLRSDMVENLDEIL